MRHSSIAGAHIHFLYASQFQGRWSKGYNKHQDLKENRYVLKITLTSGKYSQVLTLAFTVFGFLHVSLFTFACSSESCRLRECENISIKSTVIQNKKTI